MIGKQIAAITITCISTSHIASYAESKVTSVQAIGEEKVVELVTFDSA